MRFCGRDARKIRRVVMDHLVAITSHCGKAAFFEQASFFAKNPCPLFRTML
jgi:hypothetical protein